MGSIDAIIAGAGVVGLAIARRLAISGRRVLLIEAERAIGQGISSRSSEVIHAGLYYPPGSLKALLCTRGRAALYAYCAANRIGHRRCGKLVIAVDAAQIATLEAIAETALANGVDDLELLDRPTLANRAPALSGIAALSSPSTGIVDSHALLLTLLAEAEAHGTTLALNTRIESVKRSAAGWSIAVAGEASPIVTAPLFINAAGLGAIPLAARIEGVTQSSLPQQHFARGRYFAYAGRHPFDTLIYPMPEPGGLGVHLTLDLAGAARFGPDVTWLDAPDYSVDPAAAPAFAAAIRRYWPAIDATRLHPGHAGVRPKIAGPGDPAADFRIDGPASHGLTGLINLFGIESPGITAALAMADHVAALLEGPIQPAP